MLLQLEPPNADNFSEIIITVRPSNQEICGNYFQSLHFSVHLHTFPLVLTINAKRFILDD